MEMKKVYFWLLRGTLVAIFLTLVGLAIFASLIVFEQKRNAEEVLRGEAPVKAVDIIAKGEGVNLEGRIEDVGVNIENEDVAEQAVTGKFEASDSAECPVDQCNYDTSGMVVSLVDGEIILRVNFSEGEFLSQEEEMIFLPVENLVFRHFDVVNNVKIDEEGVAAGDRVMIHLDDAGFVDAGFVLK